jgi:hypothetical protein
MTLHEPFAMTRVTYRRELTAIERRLAADAPDLSARLAMFSQLAGGDAPAGAERVPPPAWGRPRMVYLAVLLVLAAIVTLCVYPSGHRPAPRSCPAAASAYAGARGPACNAYPNTRQ